MPDCRLPGFSEHGQMRTLSPVAQEYVALGLSPTEAKVATCIGCIAQRYGEANEQPLFGSMDMRACTGLSDTTTNTALRGFNARGILTLGSSRLPQFTGYRPAKPWTLAEDQSLIVPRRNPGCHVRAQDKIREIMPDRFLTSLSWVAHLAIAGTEGVKVNMPPFLGTARMDKSMVHLIEYGFVVAPRLPAGTPHAFELTWRGRWTAHGMTPPTDCSCEADHTQPMTFQEGSYPVWPPINGPDSEDNKQPPKPVSRIKDFMPDIDSTIQRYYEHDPQEVQERVFAILDRWFEAGIVEIEKTPEGPHLVYSSVARIFMGDMARKAIASHFSVAKILYDGWSMNEGQIRVHLGIPERARMNAVILTRYVRPLMDRLATIKRIERTLHREVLELPEDFDQLPDD